MTDSSKSIAKEKEYTIGSVLSGIGWLMLFFLPAIVGLLTFFISSDGYIAGLAGMITIAVVMNVMCIHKIAEDVVFD